MSKGKLDQIVSELADRCYPVGSIVITSTNTNPSAIYGGTWTLVRKRFTPVTLTGSSTGVTFNTTNTQSGASVVQIYKDIVWLRLTFAPKVSFADNSLTVATIDYTKFGLSSMYTTYHTCPSDALNGAFMLTVASTVTSVDVITKTTATSIAASTSTAVLSIPIMAPYTPANMIDSFCDEFWWRRTA